MNDLSLATTQELIDELAKRIGNLVVLGIPSAPVTQQIRLPSQSMMVWSHPGNNKIATAGLLRFATLISDNDLMQGLFQRPSMY